MKKILLIIFALIPILLNGQKNIFIPDTSVSGIKLLDLISLKAIIPNIRMMTDYTGPGAHAYLLNKNESENVILTFHAGGNAYVVAEIHIFEKDKGQIINPKTVKLDVDRFSTESNIKLFISKNDLIKIKGRNYKLETSKSIEILKYSFENFESSTFLQRYNYPKYYADYTFKDDKLIKIDFGFYYP